MSYEWREIQCGDAKKPLARSSHAVDVINRNAYVMGGEHQPRIPIGSAVWSLDLDSETWRELNTKGESVPPRNANASAVVGTNIYIFGGRQGVAMGEGSLADMYKLTTVDMKWSPVLMSGAVPEARSYHAMTAIGTTIYVFGGCTQTARLNDLYAFDIVSEFWKKLPTSPDISGRGGAGLTAIGPKLYVVGGFSGEETGDVHEFNTETSTWRQVNTTPSLPPRSVAGVTSLGKRIFVIGGEVDPSNAGHAGAGAFSDEVYVLDTGDEARGWQKWESRGSNREMSPRGWFSASPMSEDSIFLFGGNALDNSRLDDSFILKVNPTPSPEADSGPTKTRPKDLRPGDSRNHDIDVNDGDDGNDYNAKNAEGSNAGHAP
ncbi:hypothetical protein ACOMHN_014521 [Nucella lapillus]